MILVSYDGSADADAAIDRVAQLSPGAEVVVLTIWETFTDTLARSGALGMGYGGLGGFDETQKIDGASEEQALIIAEEGAQRATATGLVATARTACRNGDLGTTILAMATELDADLIAMGTRGLSGVKSFLAGSVSHSVVQHADRAVLIVPSAELAQRRHAQSAHHAGAI